MAAVDPCDYLPYEIFTTVLSYFEPLHLATTSLVSRDWYQGSNSNYVWETLCDSLWGEKVYTPEKFITMKSEGAPKQAYKDSLIDYKRQYITVEELCSFTWNFRFKEAAGEHWVDNDPWWDGRSPHKTVFLPDGKTKYVEHLDKLPRMERRWKFVHHAAGRDGADGAFIQVNNYPPYIVSRYSNGGFIMQSCWVVYTSFPMPPRGVCADLEDAALDVTTETMSAEAMRYNIGVEFNLQDQGQIVNLLQLLAQIQHPNGVNFVNVGLEDDEDLADYEDEDDEDDGGEDAEDGEKDGEDEDMETADDDGDDMHDDVNTALD